MGKTEKPAAPAKTTEPKRKMLTPEERVAKLEADLAEARKKAEAKANKQVNEAKDQRAKLVAKRDEIQAKIDKLTEVIGDNGETPATEAPATDETNAA